MFVGGTQFYAVDGEPMKNQMRPLCTNECPGEADLGPLQVACKSDNTWPCCQYSDNPGEYCLPHGGIRQH